MSSHGTAYLMIGEAGAISPQRYFRSSSKSSTPLVCNRRGNGSGSLCARIPMATRWSHAYRRLRRSSSSSKGFRPCGARARFFALSLALFGTSALPRTWKDHRAAISRAGRRPCTGQRERFLKKVATAGGRREEEGPGADCIRRLVCAVHGVT